MLTRDVYDLPMIFAELADIVTADERHHVDATYYFRGERTNFKHNGAEIPPREPPVPGIYRNEGLLDHESDILNEAIRTFPAQFKDDKTTFEILTRMQHYGYATRLLDVTQKITTALGMVLSPDGQGDCHIDDTGFIHVYRVRKDKIKFSTGDTVTALSNLARIQRSNVRLADLGYLAYECKNERAGFVWKKADNRDDDLLGVSAKLDSDIKKVWCVKPVVNNPRIDFQLGEFLLFGCGDEKEYLNVSFSESDYCNRESATFGIARIAVLAITPSAKKAIGTMSTYLDIGVERLYPDFHYHSEVINRRFKK